MIDIIENPQGPPAVESGYFIDADGNYYEGDKLPGATAVPQRPSPGHAFKKNKWTADPKLAAQAAINSAEAQQAAVLTARALREAVLAAFEAGGKTSSRVYADLKTIDDAIAAERAKL